MHFAYNSINVLHVDNFHTENYFRNFIFENNYNSQTEKS